MSDPASTKTLQQEPAPSPETSIQDALLQLQQAMQNMAARQAEFEQGIANSYVSLQQRIQQNTDAIATVAPPADLPRRPTTTSTKAKVATPPDFDGDRGRGRAFINSCNIYIRLCNGHFEDDQAKILWALSYMKSGRAAKWADAIFRWEAQNPEAIRFIDWEDFVSEFQTHFYPVDAEASAVNVLESAGYYQKARSVDDYLDEFRNLIADSGYTDSKVVVVKFRRGLNPSIQNAIATMVTGRPSDADYEGWYRAARRIDQARAANEAFQATGRSEPL